MTGVTRVATDGPDAAGLGRRSFLGKLAAGGAVAWAAPMIVSRPALAAGTCLFTPLLLAGGGQSNGDFVVVGSGPLWRRSNDGGLNWAASATPPPSTFVPALLAGGGNGTGNAGSNFVATDGAGAWYRTANGGGTWTQVTDTDVNGTFNATLLAGWGSSGAAAGNGDFVAFQPGATAGARWRYSLNGGVSWSAPGAGPGGRPPLGFTPTLLAGGGDNTADPGDFVAVNGATGAAYYSLNGGQNWTSVAVGAPPGGIAWTLLAGGDDVPGNFVITNGAGAWRYSVDGGQTWATPTGGGPPINAVVLAGGGDSDGTGANRGDFVAASATGQWYRSSDGGQTWVAVTTPPPAGFVPALLAGVGDAEGDSNDFVTTDGACGWYRSIDGGTTWSLIVAPPA